MLLKARGKKVRGRSHRTVVFDASGDLLGEVIADFHVGRKNKTLAHRLAMQGAVEGRVEIEIPATELLIDDGAHLPSPGVGGELAALVADFVGKAETDGPLPFFGDGNAGADVVTDPLNAQAIALGSEDVKSDFEPVREAVGDFNGFVQRVVGGIETVFGGFGAIDGEIAMEFEHGVAWRDEIVAIDLDFVVVLSANRPWKTKK